MSETVFYAERKVDGHMIRVASSKWYNLLKITFHTEELEMDSHGNTDALLRLTQEDAQWIVDVLQGMIAAHLAALARQQSPVLE